MKIVVSPYSELELPDLLDWRTMEMTNGRSGVRFDVYEKVHLPDDVYGIDELEDIELVPQMQVIQQDQQVILRGKLLLAGTYRATIEGVNVQKLEHRIPVEITLPLSKVTKLEELTVEIDHFDVDLLSTRTLNVTGVLSLHGVQMEQPMRDWPEESNESNEPHGANEQATISSEQVQQAEQERLAAEMAAREAREREAREREALERAAQEQAAQEKAAQQRAIQEQAAAAAREAELLAQMQHNMAPEQVEVEPQATVVTPNGKRERPAETMDWQKLFSIDGQETMSGKMRLYVVKREERLIDIAERYRVNSRELALCNRLSEQTLTEGQILLIP